MLLTDMLWEMERMVCKFSLEFAVRLFKGPSAFDHLDWETLKLRIGSLPKLENIHMSVVDRRKQAAPEVYDIPRRHLLPLQEKFGVVVHIPS